MGSTVRGRGLHTMGATDSCVRSLGGATRRESERPLTVIGATHLSFYKILLSHFICLAAYRQNLRKEAKVMEVVTYFLPKRYGIKTVDEILWHFYFNREWWRWRYRIYTPAPNKEHARHGFVSYTQVYPQRYRAVERALHR
jgi:hypothetical protein